MIIKEQERYYIVTAALLLVIAASFISANISGSATQTCSKTSTEKIGLGSSITASNGISQDLSNEVCMWSGEVHVQGEDYSAREMVVLNQAGKSIAPETALTRNREYSDVVLETDKDAIKYYFIFDDPPNLALATKDQPLEIPFLGKTLKITNVKSDTEFTAMVGDERFLHVTESAPVADKTVKLANVGSDGAIMVEVDGVIDIIKHGSTKRVNGLEITNIEAFYDSGDVLNNVASIGVGAESIVTVADGEAYLGEEEDHPNWVWNIGGLTSQMRTSTSKTAEFTGPYIGVENDFAYHSSDDSLTAGKCISLPNTYLQICLEGLSSEDYTSVEINVETADLSAAGGGAAETTTHFYASDEIFSVSGARTREIWLAGGNLYYNSGGPVAAAFDGTNIATIDNLQITIAGGTITIASPVAGDDIAFSFSGSSVGSLTWNGRDITEDEGVLRTMYGIIIENPASNSEVSLSVPDEQVEAEVSVKV